MSTSFSPPNGPRTAIVRPRQRGAALIMVVSAIVSALFLAALAIDAGIGYVTRARLNRAADAGALAGAKRAARGTGVIVATAQDIAAMNYPGSQFAVQVAVGLDDTLTVDVTGARVANTWFARLMHFQQYDVRATAQARRLPIDLSLVLDVSYSMQRSGSFDEMQDAAKDFIASFDEARDQVGIVAFSTVAWEVYPMQKHFGVGAAAAIDGLRPVADTNSAEGILHGHTQVLAAPPRAADGPKLKVVVLFTDGRPTAFTSLFHDLRNDPSVHCVNGVALQPEYYGVMAGYSVDNAPIRALMEPNLNAHTRKIRCFTATGAEPVAFAVSSEPSPRPLALPDGGTVDSPGVRQYAKALALDEATATRRDHVAIYTVGLGNPAASNPLEAPDLPFLQDIANDNGRVDRQQPRGIMVFAADNTELHASFMRVADRILTRLSL